MAVSKTNVLAAVDTAIAQVEVIKAEFAGGSAAVTGGPLTNCSRAIDSLKSIADEFRGGGYHNTY